VIPAGTNCTFKIAFAPQSGGDKIASLQVLDDATGGFRTVPLSGTGQPGAPQVCQSATTLSFSTTLVNTTNSSVLSVTFTNCGTQPLTLTSLQFVGTAAGDFFQDASTPACGSPLLPGSFCTVGVRFRPTATGLRTATLKFYDDAATSPQNVTLSGQGAVAAPDALISRTRKPSTFIGGGIISTNGDSETIAVKAGRGSKKVFFVRILNAGGVPDSFLVHGGDDVVQGYTVRYFLGAVPRESLDITAAVKAGTFATTTMAGGATTGDATLIRVEMKVSKQAFSGFLSNLITVTSTTVSNKIDAVKATAVVR
jgi:hypothetical protein